MGTTAILLFAGAILFILLAGIFFKVNENWQKENKSDIIKLKARAGLKYTLNFKGYSKLILICQIGFIVCIFFSIVCGLIWLF